MKKTCTVAVWAMLISLSLIGCGKNVSSSVPETAKQSIVTMIVLVWSRALGEFGATLMLVGVTRMKTETLPASIYLNISTGENGMAMACAIILLMISAMSLAVTTLLGGISRQHTRIKDVNQ